MGNFICTTTWAEPTFVFWLQPTFVDGSVLPINYRKQMFGKLAVFNFKNLLQLKTLYFKSSWKSIIEIHGQ